MPNIALDVISTDLYYPVYHVTLFFPQRLYLSAIATAVRKPTTKIDLNKTFSRPVLPGILLIVSILLTVIAWYISRTHLVEKTTARFNYKVGNTQSAIQVRMLAYEQVLRSAVGFFNASGNVTRQEWRDYVATLRLQEFYPGIQGLGYTVHLLPHEVEPLIARMKSEGLSHFKVWPEHPRDEYFSIIYLEPFAGKNLRALGFDMYAEKYRRQAMERAWHTGQPSLSRIVTLVQETNQDVQKGCLLYLPVYDRSQPHSTKEQRKEALRGFVYSPFRINDLMAGILDTLARDIEFEIYDGKTPESNSLFYASHGFNQKKSRAKFSTSRHLTVGGNEWTLVFTSRPGFVSSFEANQPNIIAVAGILVNLLLLWVIVKVNQLSRRNRQLAESYKAEKDRYEIVSLSTNDIIWEWELAENIVTVNKNYELVLGHPLNSSRLDYQTWTSHLHPADKQRVVAKMQAYIKEGNQLWSEEYRLLKADGTFIYILDRARLIYQKDGTPVRMVGSMINITGRKQSEEAQKQFNEHLEKTVQERTTELQRSNEDLERFAHVTSHDLKEPVRKMLVSVDILNSKYRDKLGEGAVLLDRLSRSASRLGSMIDSILAYSTVKYGAQTADQVDLNSVIEHVREDLELVIAESGATIAVDKLPVVEGSSVLIHQLFYNLLNNALKFTKAGVKPIITISARVLKTRGDVVEISVTDNGIGFSPEQAENIFRSFVRLHSKDRYEGTGIGLALCKRIVERHGGTIEAKATPGEGATFIVTLPTKQQQTH